MAFCAQSEKADNDLTEMRMLPGIFNLDDPSGFLHTADRCIDVMAVVFADAGMPVAVALLRRLRFGKPKRAQHGIIRKHFILQRIITDPKRPQPKLRAGEDVGGGQAGDGADAVRRCILLQPVCNKAGSSKQHSVVCRMLERIGDANEADGLSAPSDRNGDQSGDVLAVQKIKFQR